MRVWWCIASCYEINHIQVCRETNEIQVSFSCIEKTGGEEAMGKFFICNDEQAASEGEKKGIKRSK